LREAAKKIEAEEELSHQENKQLRELFLAMDDAMKDSQRLIIRSLLADQLQRSDERKLESGSGKPKGEGRGRGMGPPPGGMQ